MKKFLILLLLAPSIANADKEICYFSLNNDKEFKVTKKFIDGLDRVMDEKVIVHEYLPDQCVAKDGSKKKVKCDAKESFKKMVASGVKCDGLVITGHHYSNWTGVRSSGRLGLELIEELSCLP